MDHNEYTMSKEIIMNTRQWIYLFTLAQAVVG